jgi:hypothetical protein
MSENSWATEIFVPNVPHIDGAPSDVGDEFTFTDHSSLQCRFRLTEVTPARRGVWRAMDSDVSFVEERNEWTDTQVIFYITLAASTPQHKPSSHTDRPAWRGDERIRHSRAPGRRMPRRPYSRLTSRSRGAAVHNPSARNHIACRTRTIDKEIADRT